MKALLCREYGPPQSLKLEEVADLEPEANEVVVNVHAVGINYPDSLQVAGKYQFQPPFPFAPGSEVAGVIHKVGANASGWSEGDRVFGMCGIGGLAEQVKLDHTKLFKVPESMSFEVASGFPMIYGTSWYALKQRAGLKAGETLLVTGAAGGVGISAVQLGKAVGARVIAAASTDEKCAIAKEIGGADETINYSTESLKDRVKELTDKQGADVIYDPVGGDLFDQCMRSVGWEGRVLVIGFTSGIPKLPTNLVLLKSCQVIGVFWGAWTGRDPADSDQNFKELFEMHREGKLKPIVTKTFSLAEGADAIQWLADRKATGKVVVKVQ